MPETADTHSTPRRLIQAHVTQSGLWFAVVAPDGGYVREGDEDSREVSYLCPKAAQAHADRLNAAAFPEGVPHAVPVSPRLRSSRHARHDGRVLTMLRDGANYAEVTAETGVPKHVARRLRKAAGVAYAPARSPWRAVMQDPARRAAALAARHPHLAALSDAQRADYCLFRSKRLTVAEAMTLATAPLPERRNRTESVAA